MSGDKGSPARADEARERFGVSDVLVLLVAVSYPFNYTVALGLRVTDFLIVALVLSTLARFRVAVSGARVMILFFFILYAGSILYGVLTFGIITPTNFLFIYKYVNGFVLLWAVTSLRLRQFVFNRLARLQFVVFMILVIWVFVYVLLRLRGVFQGNLRVSFPFSNKSDAQLSDSPVYSVVLATSLVAYLFVPRSWSKGEILRASAVTAITCAAILLSGSRTGILVLGGTLSFFMVRRLSRALLSGVARAKRRTFVLALWGFLVLIAAVSVGVEMGSGSIGRLASRALSFGADASSSARLAKATYAITQVFGGPVLLGIGSQSTFHVWFDSSWPNVLINTGPLGVIAIPIAAWLFLRGQKARARSPDAMRWFDGLTYVFVAFFIASISTEWFLVTRGMVPFAIAVGLFGQGIRQSPPVSSGADL